MEAMLIVKIDKKI